MATDRVLAAVDRALGRATEHLAGNCDPRIPDHLDSQVQTMQQTLREMKFSLEDADGKHVQEKGMAHAIADGWPYDSELGQLICEAERLYHSVKGRL